MTGVKFVVDEKGHKTAVQLDLTEWGELWEDMYDAKLAEERLREPPISLEDAKKRMAEARSERV